MKIKNGWKYQDGITGLTLEIKERDVFNILRITGELNNNLTCRDFFFTKSGDFDGTGGLPKKPKD